MRLVSKYGEFCELHDRGKVRPDVTSPLGWRSVESLKERGWKIRRLRAASDLLRQCRRSAEDFELAFRVGIDFWVDSN